MMRYILTGWLAMTLAFVGLRAIPGDAISSQLRAAGGTEEQITAQRELFGLDKPLIQQYIETWADYLRGDFGISLTSRERVSVLISDRAGPTFALAGASLLIATILGWILGSLAVLDAFSFGHHARTRHCRVPTRRFLIFTAEGITALTLAVPVYWSATMMIYLGAHQLKFLGLPSGGTRGYSSLYLPALVLGIAVSGGITRIVAAGLRDNLTRQFIITARAKGLHPLRVYDHALRASLLPILSIIALQAGFLLSGAVIIEFMFTRRGLGSLLHQSVLNQDYPVVQALVLLAAIFYAITRAIAGWLGRRADPRLT
jgi:peptide/nickel transport system permease protein